MKKFLAGIMIASALALPLTCFAAPPVTSSAPNTSSRPMRPGIDYGKLTDQQKQDMVNSMRSILQARRLAIVKMMENKTITKEQGEAMLSKIDARINYLNQHGFDGMKDHFGHHKKTMNDGSKASE